MRGQELIIVFKEDLAFLTEEVALDQTQVPISSHPTKFKAPAFWTIRVINYIVEEKRLFVEVLCYQVGEIEFSDNQIQLADTLMEVEKVTFKSIDTTGLIKTSNSPHPLIYFPPKQETVYRGEIQRESKFKQEPVPQNYCEPFSIPIKNVRFISGGVSFEKKIQMFNKPVSFQIPNENIVEAYDAIKNYFASALKTKKIEVVPAITIVNGEITSINASSNEIDKIDETFIEEVKFEIIKVAKKKESTGDKHLFTMEEYLETFAGDDVREKGIYKDDNDLFEILLKDSDPQHYNHLRFLSSKHKADIQKLRFVQKPFSFVFLLSGLNNFYIVWETLDTQEATYIWTVANDIQDLKQIFTDVDKTINLIIKDGKNGYISRNEENFNRVFHDYTDLQNGFKKWKEGIEKVIV